MSRLCRLIKIACIILMIRRQRRIMRQPCRTSILSGHEWVVSIINGNPRLCPELFRMESHVFIRLCYVFREKGYLKDTRNISVEEMIAMFITIVGQNHRNRILQDRFQHSGETISRHFHKVLKGMLLFSMEMIKPPDMTKVPAHIENNPQFQHFKGCVGAIDGTLVHAVLPVGDQNRYRGRKGDCMQNVVAACDFNMLFTYVIAGWEGTAHDSRILMDALTDPRLNFPHPPTGKYYLVDAGFSNMRGFLAPYRQCTYWLPDFNARRPRTKQELFNYRHSQLRNVIERSFGVLKARFPILKRMPNGFKFGVQTGIVVAAMTLHNFIKQEQIADNLFEEYGSYDTHIEEVEDFAPPHDNLVNQHILDEMGSYRNMIADLLSLGYSSIFYFLF